MKATCSEKCLVTFHRSCWENIKGGTPMRNFFDSLRDCMTPDCFGTITFVKKYNLDGVVVDEWKSKEVEDKEKGKKKKKNSTVEIGRKVHEECADKKSSGQKVQQKREHRVSETIDDEEKEKLSQSKSPLADGPTSEQGSPPPSKEHSPFLNEFCPEEASLPSELASKAIPPGAAASPDSIPLEAILAIDEKDLVKLEKPEELQMEERRGKMKRNKKKKKRKDSQASIDLQFMLLPDSYRRNKTNIPTTTASEASRAEQQSTATVSTSLAATNEPLQVPSESSSIPLEMGLSQIETYVRSQGGRVLMGQLLAEVDTWRKEVKQALEYPLIKRAVELDEKQRVSVFQRDGECCFTINLRRESQEAKVDTMIIMEHEEDEKCIFCMEDLSIMPQTRLPHCQHSFHQSCIAFYRGRNCPICRAPRHEDYPALQ